MLFLKLMKFFLIPSYATFSTNMVTKVFIVAFLQDLIISLATVTKEMPSKSLRASSDTPALTVNHFLY